MHYIDALSTGRIAGWLAPAANGCPGSVILERGDRRLAVFASVPRADVLAAGYALFCGFELRLSSGTGDAPCSVSVGDEVRAIAPLEMADAALISLDGGDAHSLTGWINCPAGLRSLIFHHHSGATRAEIVHRSDVNDHLGSAPGNRHGFAVEGLDVTAIHALNINNTHVHWPDPRTFRHLV